MFNDLVALAKFSCSLHSAFLFYKLFLFFSLLNVLVVGHGHSKLCGPSMWVHKALNIVHICHLTCDVEFVWN